MENPIPSVVSTGSMSINPDGTISMESIILMGGDIGTGYGTQPVKREFVTIGNIKRYIKCYKQCRGWGGTIRDCATGYCVGELNPTPGY